MKPQHVKKMNRLLAKRNACLRQIAKQQEKLQLIHDEVHELRAERGTPLRRRPDDPSLLAEKVGRLRRAAEGRGFVQPPDPTQWRDGDGVFILDGHSKAFKKVGQ